MASWAAVGSDKTSRETLVASWASSAAASLQQQHHNMQSDVSDNSTAEKPNNQSIQYAGDSTHALQDNAVPLKEVNISVPPPHYNISNVNSSDAVQTDTHEGSSRQTSGEEWHPVNGSVAHSGIQQDSLTERSLEGLRSKPTERQSNITDRNYRIRSHGSGDRQKSRSPRASVLEERGSRSGRDLDSSSSRGRSHTPRSRSRSPRSAHGRSRTPESRSGMLRKDQTPTPINGIDSFKLSHPQTLGSISPNAVQPSTVTPKVEQSDIVTDTDILDDVSDISDGDIPDIPASSDKESDTKGGQQAFPIDTASSDQV